HIWATLARQRHMLHRLVDVALALGLLARDDRGTSGGAVSNEASAGDYFRQGTDTRARQNAADSKPRQGWRRRPGTAIPLSHTGGIAGRRHWNRGAVCHAGTLPCLLESDRHARWHCAVGTGRR